MKITGDLHIHVIMDGVNYRRAVELHRNKVDISVIQRCFSSYQKRSIGFLRDGGDARNVSYTAKKIAPEYGIDYRTPIFAIHKNGHYGGIVGRGFDTMEEYRELVHQVIELGGDFIKIMVSGLMEFDQVGVLSEDGLEESEIREMIQITHEEGMAVMAHTNGVCNAKAALLAGVDSLEHGAYMDEECLQLLAGSDTIWVPTLAPTSNMIGKGRFDDTVLHKIAAGQAANIRRALALGCRIGLGSDAGAWAVPHMFAPESEYRLLVEAVGTKQQEQLDCVLKNSELDVRKRFRRNSGGK